MRLGTLEKNEARNVLGSFLDQVHENTGGALGAELHGVPRSTRKSVIRAQRSMVAGP